MKRIGFIYRRLARRIRAAMSGAKRADILEILPKDSVGAEIGVFRGGFTKHILRVVEPRKLHLIDCWSKLYGERFPNWGRYTNFGTLKTATALREVRDIIGKYDRKQASTIHEGDDLACLGSFPDGYFDWVYIDTAHDYEHNKAVLETVRSKVKKGGMIAGHDWEDDPSEQHHGVYLAVTEFCRKYGWKEIKLDDFTQWCIKEVR
jgi:hypothetical protein